MKNEGSPVSVWERGLRALKRRARGIGSRLRRARAAAVSAPVLRSNGAAARKANLPLGVNVAGYLAGEFGVAEAARNFVHALKAADLPHVLNNIVENTQRHQDTSFDAFRTDNPYAVNVLNVNADAAPQVREYLGGGYFSGRYNVGMWYWELSRFPDRWHSRFEDFDEIWVTSGFCLETIGKVSPVPVVKITSPIYIAQGVQPVPSRAAFGLPEDAVAFLFSFDYDSVFERKNPLGVVAAFREAFGGSREAVLVLKTINSHRCPDKVADLHQATKGLNVRFVNEHFSRAQTLCLLATCDCYVSLHRSEGLGLGMAEAMYLGKPVVATGYSGNLDFMTVNNSYLVRYQMVELAEDYGAYERGNVWAEPDVAHAAEQLRRVLTDRDAAAALGRRASDDIKTRMSPAAAGREIHKRLLHIAKHEGLPLLPAIGVRVAPIDALTGNGRRG